MAQQDLGYGPCLTNEEYLQRIVALQEAQPEMPTKAQERESMRQQLELAIDRRLGTRFPQEKRDALHAARERLDRRRWLVFFLYQIRTAFRRPHAGERGLGEITAMVTKEFGKVLTPAEMERFFEPGEF